MNINTYLEVKFDFEDYFLIISKSNNNIGSIL